VVKVRANRPKKCNFTVMPIVAWLICASIYLGSPCCAMIAFLSKFVGFSVLRFEMFQCQSKSAPLADCQSLTHTQARNQLGSLGGGEEFSERGPNLYVQHNFPGEGKIFQGGIRSPCVPLCYGPAHTPGCAWWRFAQRQRKELLSVKDSEAKHIATGP